MNVSARPEETVDIKFECMLLSAMVYLPWTSIRQQASLHQLHPHPYS